MVFFRKIGKITILHTELTSSIKFAGRKLRKIGFFAKTINVLKSFSLQLVAQVTIVENTENSHNSRLYTIQQKISEKFSPIISKIWHFLKCHNNCIPKSVNCSHTKISKEQLTAHMPIVKRITVSVTNTHLSSSNVLLCQLVSQTHKLLKQLNTYGYCKLQHKQILWLVLLVLKAVSPLIYSTYHRYQTRRNTQQ